jgi:hypothetical protein
MSPAVQYTRWGGARMGDDPRKSVVYKWSQAHDAANLFVTDCAQMAMDSCVNPSLISMPLIARAAHHARKQFKAPRYRAVWRPEILSDLTARCYCCFASKAAGIIKAVFDRAGGANGTPDGWPPTFVLSIQRRALVIGRTATMHRPDRLATRQVAILDFRYLDY